MRGGVKATRTAHWAKEVSVAGRRKSEPLRPEFRHWHPSPFRGSRDTIRAAGPSGTRSLEVDQRAEHLFQNHKKIK